MPEALRDKNSIQKEGFPSNRHNYRRGKWHAREQEAIMEIVSKAMEGYLVVKTAR